MPGRPACLQPAAKGREEGGKNRGEKEGGRKRQPQGQSRAATPSPPTAARPRLPAKMAARRGGANAVLPSPSGKAPPRSRRLASASGTAMAAEGTLRYRPWGCWAGSGVASAVRSDRDTAAPALQGPRPAGEEGPSPACVNGGVVQAGSQP